MASLKVACLVFALNTLIVETTLLKEGLACPARNTDLYDPTVIYNPLDRVIVGGKQGVPTVEDCSADCRENMNCTFWTWYSRDHRCLLVSRYGNASFLSGAISGNKNCDLSCPAPSTKEHGSWTCNENRTSCLLTCNPGYLSLYTTLKCTGKRWYWWKMDKINIQGKWEWIKMQEQLGINCWGKSTTVTLADLESTFFGNVSDDMELYLASTLGNEEMVKALIEAGADVNATATDGWNKWTPLMKAASTKENEICELLIAAGAHVNYRDNYGNTALLVAAEYGSADTIKKLMEAGAEVNVTTNEWTPLMRAAERGSKEICKLLTEAGADLSNEVDNGKTALYLAVTFGSADIVQILTDAGADVNVKLRYSYHGFDHGRTPLINAAEKGNEEICKILISAGADVNSSAALNYAVIGGREDIITMLIDAGADVNIKFGRRSTLLMNAAKWSGNTKMCKLLIDAGAYVNSRDYFGRTALYEAAPYGSVDVVKMLIEAGADVNATLWKGFSESDSDVNNEGQTPLIKAAKVGNKEVCKLLIAAGADINHGDDEGKTALYEATSYGSVEIVKMLIEAGADVNVTLADDYVYSWEGQTPLIKAVQEGNKEICKLLIAAGADVNHKDYNGENALDEAETYGNAFIVKILIEAGAQ